MSVIVEIEGGEAIPVRAIPLLTDWTRWSPDVVAQVLAGNPGGTAFVFGELQAHRLEHGAVQAVPKRWWSFAVQNLLALSEEIKATQVGDEAGYRRWKSESLAELPASVFVWKTEFETFHRENWQRLARMLQASLPGEAEDDQEASPDSTEVRAFAREAMENLNLWRELDFAPLIQPEHQGLVMEGFDPSVTTTIAVSGTTPTAGQRPISAARKQGEPWTPEALAELKAYRDVHGTKQAASHFHISESRVRVLLPGEKPKFKGYSVYHQR